MVCTGLAFGQRGRYEHVERTIRLDGSEPIDIDLKVDAGEVTVIRGSQRSAVEISMRFTRDEFRESIDYNKKRNRLRIELDKKGWLNTKDDDDKQIRAYVDIELPTQVDLYLNATVKAGEVDMALGGLRLKEFVFRNWAGDVEIRFDEPNQITMDLLDMNAKVGEARFLRLGNARFEIADINGGIGEMRVDFTGDLVPDSRARVDLDIGEAVVRLPRDRGIKMNIGGTFSFLSSKNISREFYRRGKIYYSDNYDDSRERFFIRVTPGLGELTVDME
jgi:hypothetical protein